MASQVRSAGAGASIDVFGGTPWSGTADIVSSNNVHASAFGSSTVTQRLRASAFGFSIPAGSTINGITVRIERSQGGDSNQVRDYEVVIYRADGTPGATNKADTATDWPTNGADSYKTYGSSVDLWGETWTPADINDVDFGVGLIPQRWSGGSSWNPAVDHIEITVDYTAPNTAPSTPGAFSVPSAGQIINATVTADWGDSTDPEGDAVTYNLEYSSNNGGAWSSVASNFAGSSRVVDTSGFSETTQAKFRVQARDPAGLTSAWRESSAFTIAHPRTGPITNTLPALSQSAQGAVEAGGPVAQALPALTQSATATSLGGPISQTLPALTQAAQATSLGGPINQVLPALQTRIVGPSYVSEGAPARDRDIAFMYELLDSSNRHKGWLDKVLSGSIANNALAEIKRTARFSIRDTSDIDWLADRIKPWVELNGDIYPQGVFLLSSPVRRHDGAAITRAIEAFDQAVVLRDDKVTTRYTIAVGANYITEVRTALTAAGITDVNLTPTSKTLPAVREWDPGTSRLRIVNDLLAAINYRSLYFDADGQAVGEPYLSPALAAPNHIYADDADSVILRGVEETLDLFDIPNKWVLYTSEPNLTPLRAEYTNTNAASPTSTVRRGRTIVDYRQVEAADQGALDAIVARLAFEASQVYTSVEMTTAIMPDHGDADVVEFAFSRMGISGRYSEPTWEFPLKPGAPMKHRIRRVVTV